MKKSTKKILLEWAAALAFIIFNLMYNQTSSRNFGIAFILFAAIIATVDTLKKADNEGSNSPHINIQILKERYGKYYLPLSYWSLALMLVTLTLRVILPENQLVTMLLPFVLAVFVIHGIYLLCIIALSKSQRRRRFAKK